MSYGYRLKRGVLLFMSPEIERMLDVLGPVYEEQGVPLWVTSGVDGPHRAGSLHYKLRAFDTRSFYNEKLKDKALMAAKLAHTACKSLGLPVNLVLESDHHHWEWGDA